MDVAQMMAHCNLAYELVYTDKHCKPMGFQKFIIKFFVKNIVVGPKPYKRNGRTAPVFVVTDRRDFETEKTRLIADLQKTQLLGTSHFDGMGSHAFRPLKCKEWNTLFPNQLDRHLMQFGA